MTGKDILFLIFAAMSVGAASIVVFSKKITYAAFALMMSLFSVGALYVFLSADFLAAVQLIIYVGGILVLLLFGVLLTTKITAVMVTTLPGQRVWGALTSIGIFGLLFYAIYRGTFKLLPHGGNAYMPQSERIGELLMTKYLLPFEIASILLLVALIGSMFIVRAESKSENK